MSRSPIPGLQSVLRISPGCWRVLLAGGGGGGGALAKDWQIRSPSKGTTRRCASAGWLAVRDQLTPKAHQMPKQMAHLDTCRGGATNHASVEGTARKGRLRVAIRIRAPGLARRSAT